MTNRNLEKALDIVSELIVGRAVDKNGDNAGLYEEYQSNSEVYDIVFAVLKKLNINIFEYNYGLYISPGENTRLSDIQKRN